MSQETNNKEVVAVVAGEEITKERLQRQNFMRICKEFRESSRHIWQIRSSVSSVWISSSRCGCMRS